ncbi:dTDP-glucose 4,6-dehydratase [Rossellomorea yichunensis]|uniref:dTDP-glucose 4,6-dehydratase n=1 Tax=Rossellomorea yichunensis TaxID=3077331 RepID=UPI0028DFD6C5|nr:dTDP-glucose 4,6-dehydratase [Rossellomorea sp. YC4-1]MDT9027894.1 dTDP-glucose 4,6-dehydratase [Rossellomorea sp. YC4-1]
MKTILVTGGSGFIGSHYIDYLLTHYHDIVVINLDKLSYSANQNNVRKWEGNDHYHFVQVDLAKKEQVGTIFQRYTIDEVVHFAAESHVDRSIQSAEPFFESNVMGTLHLLDEAKNHQVQRFIQISTDEVYGSYPVGCADENAPLLAKNPYSASKAAADLLVHSYYYTHGLPVVITRCTNNYGPHQHPEKLIPHLINRALNRQYLPIYGDGLQERDWLYVEDHCSGIDLVRQNGKIGEIYHIGAEHTVPNLEVAKSILQAFDLSESMIRHVKDRPGHDVRYSLDTTKLRQELNWKPMISFDEGLQNTIRWYQEHLHWWKTT